MTAPRTRALALVTLLVLASAAAAGCLRSDLGSSTNSDVEWTGGPRGHTLSAVAVFADSATLAGVRVEGQPTGPNAFRLGAEAEPPASHRALLVHDALVAGQGEGILVVLPGREVVIDGPMAFTSGAVTFSAAEVAYRVAADSDLRMGIAVSEAMRKRLEDAGFGGDEVFSQPLSLSTRGPVTVKAERLVLVTEEGATELGREASLLDAGVFAATTSVDRIAPVADVHLQVAGARGALALANATGNVDLDESRTVALKGHAAVSLGAPTNVTFQAPPEGGDGKRVLVSARGYAFQVYADGKAQIPGKLELVVAADRLTLGKDGHQDVKFTLKNQDPHTDAVIGRVDLSGAPDDAVRLPGFRSITETAFRDVQHNPVALLAVTTASPALIIADVFQVLINALIGPPPIPQVVEAGTQFTTELGVSGAEEPYTATLTLSGNFADQRATISVS